MISFTIPGAPRTKKNHGRLVNRFSKRPRVLPSKQYETWAAEALGSLYGIHAEARRLGISLPLGCALNCRALFYRDARTGDAVGYYQALADWLEANGVIVNDRLIEQWDGSRPLKDAVRPRIEVTLEEL